MITVYQLLMSDAVSNAVDFGYPERPVYVRLPDGSLFQVDSAETGELMTSAGKHTIIILQAGAAGIEA